MASAGEKPRISSYGLYIIGPAGVAVRAWLDYRKKVVCCVMTTIHKGWVIWAYCLDPARQQLAHDLVGAVSRTGYRCFYVDPINAVKRLEVAYDCKDPWPISAGEAAGTKNRQAVPSRRNSRGKRSAPQLPGCG